MLMLTASPAINQTGHVPVNQATISWWCTLPAMMKPGDLASWRVRCASKRLFIGILKTQPGYDGLNGARKLRANPSLLG